MRRLIVRIILVAATITMAGVYLPFLIRVSGWRGAAVAAVLLAAANSTIRPVLLFLSKPINILTVGFFTFVVDAFLLEAVAAVTGGMLVTQGFSRSIAMAFLISLVGTVGVSLLVGGD